jgi:hypothetical protein
VGRGRKAFKHVGQSGFVNGSRSRGFTFRLGPWPAEGGESGRMASA